MVPDATGGIRDYAENIKRAWSQLGIDCRVQPLSESDVLATPLWSQLQNPQVDGVDPIVLIVHYSGYGYESRGLCGWLLRELRLARVHIGLRLRVVVMFHELYASGPPWRSAFWLQGRQATIAADLAALGDVAITNTEFHARWLEQQLGQRRRVDVWPVFSNVGEPDAPAPFGALARARAAAWTGRACRSYHALVLTAMRSRSSSLGTGPARGSRPRKCAPGVSPSAL